MNYSNSVLINVHIFSPAVDVYILGFRFICLTFIHVPAMQPFAPMQHKPQDNVSPRNEHRRTNKPGTMQVVRTRDHIILQKGSECLWCSKDNGIMKPGTGG